MTLLEDALHSPIVQLEVPVASEPILRTWEQWSGKLDLPTRTCHGDLKISNLHFKNLDGASAYWT